MTPEGLCLDDDTVLEILVEIPALANDTQIFMDILEVLGCRPTGLFYMCFSFEPCSTAAQQPPMMGQPIPIISGQDGLMAGQRPTKLAVMPVPGSALCGCFDFSFQVRPYKTLLPFSFFSHIFSCEGLLTYLLK